MASASRGEAPRSAGTARCSCASRRVRCACMNCSRRVKSGVVGMVAITEGLRFGVLMLFQQDTHLLFGLLQGLLAFAGQADAILERLEGLLQRQLAGFHALDQTLQSGPRVLKTGLLLLCGHGGRGPRWRGGRAL